MLKENQKKERIKILKLFDQIMLEKPRFGKSYYKLDITEGNLEDLKQTLKEEL
jgi:tagatose-1,6-bisphosphate aldolase non-catalytic subunit AgaZ/GatZ